MSKQNYASRNPWHGCTKYSEGCRFCYVYRQNEAYGSTISPEQCRKTHNFNLPIKKKFDGTSVDQIARSDRQPQCEKESMEYVEKHLRPSLI